MTASIRFSRVLVLVTTAFALACGPSSSGDGDGQGNGNGADGGDGECAGASCLNFCPEGTQTTLTGRVLAPNGVDPIPGALVYIPRDEVSDFPSEVTCELCSQITDSALVSVTTNIDGTFSLGPIPTAEDQMPGETITLVTQKGRFRKVTEVAIDNPCEDNAASHAATQLPAKSQGLDRIPEIAVVTGDYDVMECVLLNMGLDPDAFDLFNGIQDIFGGGTPNTQGDFDQLLGNQSMMKSYNIIFINCSNDEYEALLEDETIRESIESYVASGGRLYVTDWSYDYVEQVSAFSPRIDFGPGMSGDAPEPRNEAAMGQGGITTEARVHDSDLASWLRAVENVTGEEIISDDDRVHIEHFLAGWVMQYEVAQNDDTTTWLSGDVTGGGLSGELPLTTTFDYLECGRVLYSSYHTLGRDLYAGNEFPDYCSASELSPQERVLMYLIMHVADCISID